MKYLPNFLLIVAIAMFFVSCEKAEDDYVQVEYESYRYPLWKLLTLNHYDFDFVGTKVDAGSYPDYYGVSFDRDHEGVGGIDSRGVLKNLNSVLSSVENPDIVLLGVGGNDLNKDFRGPWVPFINIVEIIEVLKAHNPDVTVLVEQIAPARRDYMDAALALKINRFNEQISELALISSDGHASVIAVDMNTGFRNIFFSDYVHYNNLGASFVANRYFSTLQAKFDTSERLTILTLGDSRVEGNRY